MARTRTLLHTSDEAQELTQQLRPLIRFRTPEGARYRFPAPLDVKLKLYDGDGNQIPANSSIYIYKRRPGEDAPIFVRKIPYAAYYDLTNGQQRDDAFVASTLHDLGTQVREVSNPEDHSLELYYESSAEVDLTQAATLLEVKTIEEN